MLRLATGGRLAEAQAYARLAATAGRLAASDRARTDLGIEDGDPDFYAKRKFKPGARENLEDALLNKIDCERVESGRK